MRGEGVFGVNWGEGRKEKGEGRREKGEGNTLRNFHGQLQHKGECCAIFQNLVFGRMMYILA